VLVLLIVASQVVAKNQKQRKKHVEKNVRKVAVKVIKRKHVLQSAQKLAVRSNQNKI